VGEGFSGPVVAGDSLFLFHRVEGKEVLDCLQAATGKPRWKFAYTCPYSDLNGKGDGPRATPAVAAGKVYTLGVAGMLSCVEAATGNNLWQRNLAEDYTLRRSHFGVGTSPLVEGDLVVINIGARDAGIVAWHKDTGKEVWRATDHEASYASPVTATIDGTRLLIFFTHEGLVGLEPATGAVRFSRHWRTSRSTIAVNAASPVVVGDHIFLTASYRTGAVMFKATRNEVKLLWAEIGVMDCHFSTPVYCEGTMYGFCGHQENAQLRAIDWKTGKVQWMENGFGRGLVIRADGTLIVMSEDGDLVLVQASPKAYQELARASVLRGPVRAHMALADGRLFARDNKRLVCWKLTK
jgi:outer membrane protein assembly factor BamB